MICECLKCPYVFSEMPKAYQCAVCGRSHLKRRRPIKVKALQKYVSKVTNREMQEDGVICDKCRALYKNKKCFRNIYAPHGAKFRFIFSVRSKICTKQETKGLKYVKWTTHWAQKSSLTLTFEHVT